MNDDEVVRLGNERLATVRESVGNEMATRKDWIRDAAEEINAVDCECFCVTLDAEMAAAIIGKHCPFKPDTAYVPVAPTGNLGQDMVDALLAGDYWMACVLAVSRNDELYRRNVVLEERNAALKGLLAKRPHSFECGAWGVLSGERGDCTCGASAWNDRVDAALRD